MITLLSLKMESDAPSLLNRDVTEVLESQMVNLARDPVPSFCKIRKL